MSRVDQPESIVAPRSARPVEGEIHFSIDAHLLFELGEQLVARKSVALAELVKNAYDADATKVIVRLNGVTQRGGSIVIEDNGVGMTFDVIQASWMRIATGEKMRNEVSERFDRIRTGAKGIGRFASRRLGASLFLETVAKAERGRREKVDLTFDWLAFEAGKDLGAVPNKYRRYTVSESTATGVKLTISGLRDTWAEGDVRELQSDLLGLISPFPIPKEFDDNSKDPGFSLTLRAPEFPSLEGRLAETLFRAAWGTLIARTDKDGKPAYSLQRRSDSKVSYRPSVAFRSLGRAYVRVLFFIYRAEFFKGLPFSVADARHLASERGGVRIYMDKFRVFPYGDPGDDWLDLDADRGRRLTALPVELADKAQDLIRPMLLVPGNNQLFGAVFLSREHTKNVELNISRERLLENDAFRELVKFVRLGIDWMTIEYARAKTEEAARSVAQTSRDPFQHFRAVRAEVEESGDIEQDRKTRILQALDLAENDWRAKEAEQISELSMLRVLASMGTTVVIFDHELRALVDAITGIHTDLRSFVTDLDAGRQPKFLELLDQLNSWKSSVEQQGAQIGLLISPSSRLRRRRLPLRSSVDRMAGSFKRYMTELGATFSNDVSADLRTPPMFECELQSVLLNLQTNALKAVKQVSNRKISVSAESVVDGILLHFRDTGVGIPHDVQDKVFDPFFTTSEPDPVLGVGTGLGLKIVRDLVEVYGGSSKVEDAPKPWNTSIAVFLPSK
jgi:signal transduction histidine kinase